MLFVEELTLMPRLFLGARVVLTTNHREVTDINRLEYSVLRLRVGMNDHEAVIPLLAFAVFSVPNMTTGQLHPLRRAVFIDTATAEKEYGVVIGANFTVDAAAGMRCVPSD